LSKAINSCEVKMTKKIFYLDENRQPIKKKDAVLGHIVNDDGTDAWVVIEHDNSEGD
jgi:hypothetical protein